jgi:hypothetical protein
VLPIDAFGQRLQFLDDGGHLAFFEFAVQAVDGRAKQVLYLDSILLVRWSRPMRRREK